MGRVVILKFEGDLQTQGFYVTLEIRSVLNQIEAEERGKLPPHPGLVKSLQDWREKYRDVGAPARIKPKRIIYNGNIQQRREACKQAAKELRDAFLAWLESDSFRPIDKQLREELQRDEEVRLLLRSADPALQKLPWHEWDFVQRHPNIEVVLTSLRQKPRQARSSSQLTSQNRILAILGHSEGINVAADRALLETLPHAEVTFLVEPQRQQLSDRLWEQSWDVIFFAGHSETEGETGRIYLNPTDSLTIEELWYALRKAVDRGLKLAIFNSCDGLGLVQRLDDLGIPHLIVMRELIPDRVAQEFLKYLLFALAEDQPVHLAVREARERLETLEPEFPCATWLPVIHQNVDYIPVSSPPAPLSSAPILLKQALLISVAVTFLVMGIRWTGFLQASELQAYDHLMRSRPVEQPDSRLLLVSIDEEDIQKYGHPISDATLALALEKLHQERPVAIGVNIIRARPVREGAAELANILRQPHLITNCHFADPSIQGQQTIDPPSASPQAQVGFTNLFDDQQQNARDYIIRRQLLSRSENRVSFFTTCATPYSFSLLLAMQYLNSKHLQAKSTPDHNWQFGNTVLKGLDSNSGGYQNLDARGHQVLINYRNATQIAQSISLRDLLNGKYQPEWIKNRIILVGVVATSVFSDQDTPLGKLPRLHIQAQMISSILSAIDADRPLIYWLSEWAEIIWVGFWATLAAFLPIMWKHPLWLGLISVLCWGLLYGLCWVSLFVGIWLPFIPAAIALLIAAGTTVFWLAPSRSNIYFSRFKQPPNLR